MKSRVRKGLKARRDHLRRLHENLRPHPHLQRPRLPGPRQNLVLTKATDRAKTSVLPPVALLSNHHLRTAFQNKHKNIITGNITLNDRIPTTARLRLRLIHHLKSQLTTIQKLHRLRSCVTSLVANAPKRLLMAPTPSRLRLHPQADLQMKKPGRVDVRIPRCARAKTSTKTGR